MKLLNIFLTINLIVSILFCNNILLIAQPCPPDYTYSETNGCHKGNLIISSAYCNSGTTVRVFLGNSIASPCPAGWNTKSWTWQYVKNNEVDWYECQMNIDPSDKQMFGLVGQGCGNGGVAWWGPTKIQLTNVNRYLVVLGCSLSIGNSFLPSANPTTTSSSSQNSNCLNAGPGTTIGYVAHWDYGETVCPNGLSNFPSCNVVVDACAAGTSGCSSGCVNNNGSFNCTCPSGYKLGGDLKTCDDINECLDTPSICGTSYCNNIDGSFSCSCDEGYTLSADIKSCVDVNECLASPTPCGASNCNNVDGSFFCSCDNGYTLSADNQSCSDTNECLDSNLNQCGQNTVCLNINGSYSCQCNSNYSHVSPYKCEPKPIITSFIQKPIEVSTFILNGFNFKNSSIVTIIDIKGNEVNCQYNSGDDNYIECSTREGLEVSGNITIETDSILSDPFEFKGAPFIISYSKNPSTEGEQITFSGRNLPVKGTIKVSVNSIDCPIISQLNDENITCNIPEGSGSFNYVKISNETVSNTDSIFVTYENPSITSTSSLYSTGGVLTIYGSNFGSISSEVTVDIGDNQCHNVAIISHTELKCELSSTNKVFTQLIYLEVNGLPISNTYYFTYSSLGSGACPSNCNAPNGICSSYGCACNSGFAGIACNETSVTIVPSLPIVDVPTIEVGNGDDNNNNNNNNEFSYKISIIRIEELDFNEEIIESIPLLNKSWNSISNTKNQWTFNITLDNESYLESTFEYFKQSKNITFASSTFSIPAESLKLSFTTRTWPFKSRLNTLRIVIQTETISKDDSNTCSISDLVSSNYNQHVWSTTINYESGMVARFISSAEIDSSIPITAYIQDLSDKNRKSSIIGVSVPYFEKQVVIDPDFSMLLNVGHKETGNCNSDNNGINWRLATGVSIGAGAAVCLASFGAYLFRQKKRDKKLKNLVNNRLAGAVTRAD